MQIYCIIKTAPYTILWLVLFNNEQKDLQMKPFALSLVDEPSSLELFQKVSRAISNTKEINFGDLCDSHGNPVVLSCHILARACGQVFRATVRDGLLYSFFNHSWLETDDRHVIDVYPVGVISPSRNIEPLLVDKRLSGFAYTPNVPGKNCFSDSDETKLLRGQEDFENKNEFNTDWFKEAVRITAAELDK